MPQDLRELKLKIEATESKVEVGDRHECTWKIDISPNIICISVMTIVPWLFYAHPQRPFHRKAVYRSVACLDRSMFLYIYIYKYILYWSVVRIKINFIYRLGYKASPSQRRPVSALSSTKSTTFGKTGTVVSHEAIQVDARCWFSLNARDRYVDRHNKNTCNLSATKNGNIYVRIGQSHIYIYVWTPRYISFHLCGMDAMLGTTYMHKYEEAYGSICARQIVMIGDDSIG
jgi:hypothetical protein